MNRKLVWPFSFNFFHFAAVAAVPPYLVLHYQSLGFSGSQIGLLTGITPLITLAFTPFWAGLADTTGRHRLVMGGLLWAAAATMLVFPFLSSFLWVLLIAVALNIFFGPLASFSDSASMEMLGDRKELYGRIRLGGTIGFGIAAVIIGFLVQKYGLRAAFWGSAALMMVNFMVSRFLKFNKTEPRKNSWQAFSRLLANRRWVLFLVLSFTGGISLGLLNNYLFPTMQQLGAGETMMGLALTVGTIAEVPIMFFSDRLIKKFGAASLIKLAILITAARFILYFTFQTPAAFLVIQLINGLTFPLFWISGVSYADQHAPPGLRTTTQGLFAALVWGFGNAAGGFLGGPLFEILGGQQLFLAFGSAFLLILAVSELIERRYNTLSAKI